MTRAAATVSVAPTGRLHGVASRDEKSQHPWIGGADHRCGSLPSCPDDVGDDGHTVPCAERHAASHHSPHPVRVVLVLGDSFGQSIASGESFDVAWVQDTPSNRGQESAMTSRPFASDVTWFAPLEMPEAERLCALLDLIELHHGLYHAPEPFHEIVVFGLHDPNALAVALENDPEFDVDVERRAIIRKDQ